ncbi:MAG TPA: type IV toxin-antitoxin system AbiEi family antitoxin domain-containing protein, partial [Thermoleophilaceae bacterium]|nr:type IV toxin-antitoxin system AbiEi family antitoxin domain-containing protein [Thermoleophilaceae bacterium]
MASQTHEPRGSARLWALTRRQEGVVSTRQLLDAGFTRAAVKHRVGAGRLHRKARGVYAVGRPDIGRHGEMWVAVLACGPQASISHETGCELYGVRRRNRGPIEVSVPARARRHRAGIRVHNRRVLEGDVTTHRRVPVTSLPLTLIDT